MSGTALTQRHRDTECRKFVDSGVAWIGQVPEGWALRRIAALYELRSQKCSDRDFAPLSVTMKGVVPQLEDVAKTNNGDERKLVRKGDFVINSRSDRRGSCGISPLDGSVSLINTVLKPRGEMNPGYYSWVFRSAQFADEFFAWGHGIVDDLWTTRWSDMKSILVMSPPLSTQRTIAAFLDRECGKIDALRGKIETQIEKLDELKKSIITEAIDNHRWPMSKVKFIAEINNGSDPRTEGDIPVYGSGESSFKTCGEFKVGPTVLIGRKGATLHIPHYIQGKYWNVDTAFDATMIGGNNLRWFYYLATVFDYRYYISQTTLPGMSQSNYYNMPIRLPPLAEQREIVEYLDRKCGAIDAAKGKCRAELEKLSEYKKSLIYECVTGKREVA